LQFLNHPIANDPSYGKPLNQCIDDTISVQNEVDNLESGDDEDGDGDGVISDGIRLPEESLLSFLTRTCEWCQGRTAHTSSTATSKAAGGDVGQRVADRTCLHRTCIWLHAWRYSMKCDDREWSFEAPLPSWAGVR
jgi:hypothetical protein